jgi:hypothetical protein
MFAASHPALIVSVLVSSTACLSAGCRGEESWVDVPRATSAETRNQTESWQSELSNDAGLPPQERTLEPTDGDAGGSDGWRTADEECRPHTTEVLELEGYADDFPVPGPDVAMTWQPKEAGVYVATLTSTGAIRAELSLLSGTCMGTELGAIQGLEGAWPGFAFVASPEEHYTFVIEGQDETETVHLSIELGCAKVDDAHCVRAGDDGKPECGVRYAAEEGTDHMLCEPMHAPGELDARCPDTTFRGAEVEGCCMPDGVCGHSDPVLGCHDLAQVDWAWSPPLEFYCDDRAVPEPPSFFECSYAACETALDCCADPTLGNASCVEGFCVPAEG